MGMQFTLRRDPDTPAVSCLALHDDFMTWVVMHDCTPDQGELAAVFDRLGRDPGPLAQVSWPDEPYKLVDVTPAVQWARALAADVRADPTPLVGVEPFYTDGVPDVAAALTFADWLETFAGLLEACGWDQAAIVAG